MAGETEARKRETKQAPLRRVPVLVSFALGLLLLIAFDLGLATLRPRDADRAGALEVQPRDGRIYLLGNSMFKTGIDPEALERGIAGGIGVDFEEHVGHYTNLWYLIVKNALIDHPETPRRVVWGFRPTYAYRPAFRQKRTCDVERFRGPSETLYDHLVSRANRGGHGAWRAWLARESGLYPRREAIRDAAFEPFERFTLSLLGIVGGPAAPRIEAELDSGRSLSAVLHERLQPRENRVAEEGYVDAGESFVLGEVVPFEQSFVPPISNLLRERAIPQLVVLFKPVAATAEGLDPRAARFAADAVRWFEAHGIPYLDMVSAPELERRHYASGDHYNAEGRALVTAKLAAALRRLEAQSEPGGLPLADGSRSPQRRSEPRGG